MAYSKALAARVRQNLARRQGIVEKRMFGGVAFLLRGNLLVGIWQESLVVRLAREDGERALSEPYTRPFDAAGRPMRGWVLIEPDGLDMESQLTAWIERAEAFVATLPAK